MSNFETVFKAISHRSRREILSFLDKEGGSLTSGDINQRFSLSWPTLCGHLEYLKRAKLISKRSNILNKDHGNFFIRITHTFRTITWPIVAMCIGHLCGIDFMGRNLSGPETAHSEILAIERPYLFLSLLFYLFFHPEKLSQKHRALVRMLYLIYVAFLGYQLLF